MKAETPAEGILKTRDFGDSIYYYIRCECGSDDDSQEIEIEADDHSVTVSIYVKSKTKWWELNRWKQIWQILTKGHAEMWTTTVMSEQTALNYAETLKRSVSDVKAIRKKMNEKINR